MAYEAWRYRDPAAIVEASLRLTARSGSGGEGKPSPTSAAPSRDRYYTRARRLHVKRLIARQR